MATEGENDGPIAVGPILKQTRERRGIELATVEEETKIRAKYLRALENEDWDVLPGPAYTRGFIRAYAELLGLDSEVLVDSHRHRYEQPPTETFELREPLLGGRSAADRPARATVRYAVLGALAAAVAVALLVLGITAGGDDEGGAGPGRSEREGAARKDAKRDRAANGGKPDEARRKVTVKLVARSDVQACLIDNRDRVLIPNQLLTSGVEDGPYSAKRFRVELDPGAARLVVDGDTAARPSSEPVGYRVTSRGVEPADFTGRLCR